MSTTRQPSTARTTSRRWTVPVIGLTIGIGYLVAAWISGDPVFGIEMLTIMVLFSAGLILGARRSETVNGLLDGRDERISAIDLKATAFTGIVLVATIIVAFIVEIARAQDGTPYTWLGALAGVSYLGAVIVLRVRR